MHPIIFVSLAITALCLTAGTAIAFLVFWHLPLLGAIGAGALVGLAFLSALTTMEDC